MKDPLVSVIMPVYNTEKFVGEAIESILGQTFTDFEFIIIDDGSTDDSWKIIQSYAEKDTRIRAMQNEGNKGISYTRNKLIQETTTDYIASMDSDDISEIGRLGIQYYYLLSEKNCAVVSGDNTIIDEKGNILGYRKYSDNIKKIILKKSPISQPSSMMRKDIFEEVGGYDEIFNYGEDYDLWCKIFSAGYEIKNISLYILKLRIRKGQTKSSKLKQTIRNTIDIQKRAIKNGLQPTLSDRMYIFAEQILLLFPSSRIMFMFQTIEYKRPKTY